MYIKYGGVLDNPHKVWECIGKIHKEYKDVLGNHRGYENILSNPQVV